MWFDLILVENQVKFKEIKRGFFKPHLDSSQRVPLPVGFGIKEGFWVHVNAAVASGRSAAWPHNLAPTLQSRKPAMIFDSQLDISDQNLKVVSCNLSVCV